MLETVELSTQPNSNSGVRIRHWIDNWKNPELGYWLYWDGRAWTRNIHDAVIVKPSQVRHIHEVYGEECQVF